MRFRLSLLCAVTGAVMISGAGQAPGKTSQPTFSGKFEIRSPKTMFWARRILVVQNAQSVDVSWLRHGQTVTYHFPLDGSKSECSPQRDRSDPDLSNKCSGDFKDGKLTLKILSIHDRNGNPTEIAHRIEEWELSKDSKTLTIHVPDAYSNPMILIGRIPPTEFDRIDGQ